MSSRVRVRYAPSPTGIPHVGNIRTAIFNWLFARHSGGSFILRIEDTDVTRKVEGAVEAILESLRWLKLDWDEGPEVDGKCGPYFQSQRLPIYQGVAQRLIETGYAYHCYCSTQRLEEMRREQELRKQPPGYDRRCRDLSEAESHRMKTQRVVPVVRFKMLLEGATTFHDLVRGEVSFEHAVLDDFVLLKSDGYPTYHLANVTDDHLMEISHVMRAEEWLSSTPRHLLLYSALGYEPPLFAHLPMILGPDKSKLSKRHGATSLLAYRDMGYLPDAMLNFLVLLGWSLDDRTELISREDLIKHFSIERIGLAGAIFNLEKLSWMNGVYIRQMDASELSRAIGPYLERDLPSRVQRPLDLGYVRQVLPLVQERIRTLAEAPSFMDFFFLPDLEYDSALLVQKGTTVQTVQDALQRVLAVLEGAGEFDQEGLEGRIRPLADELGLKTGQLFGAIRVAVTGRTAAPPLFQTMAVLGRDRCLGRLKEAVRRLERA